MNKTELTEIEVQKPVVVKDKDLIKARYDFLLSEQPKLQTEQSQRFITSVTGGCVATIYPIYMDYQEAFQDIALLGVLVLCFFIVGLILVHTINGHFTARKNKQVLINNIELLQNWTRPIILLPENRFDPSVDTRAKEIITILDDDKFVNSLHIALENAEICFNYSIAYGFRTGEKCQTNKGLPVVALFPELFMLRGAFDENVWSDFQKEAVRIVLEIDNEFAKSWYTLESDKYRMVAGGQLMI
jgi:hypothetical protein